MIQLRKLCLVIILLRVPGVGIAQSLPDHDSLTTILRKGLIYLVNTQKNETIPGYQFAGEWPSFMSMRTAYMLLAKPDDAYDSNCFSLAAICNSLSNLYLNDNSLNEIPAMLDKAIPRLLSYYNGASFNFWPLLPPSGRLYVFRPNKPVGLVRRPIQFSLSSPYIRKAANIMNDNDDTAQGYLALWNYSQIKNRYARSSDSSLLFPALYPFFDAYRDTNRNTAHYYNIFAGDARSSGAYLTWRGTEENFPSWNIPRLLINNLLFLFPLSTAYPFAYESYMPYFANDVDAVVNANILTLLASTGEVNSAEGSNSAAAFITKKIKNEIFT